jgi:hypothetical protein
MFSSSSNVSVNELSVAS